MQIYNLKGLSTSQEVPKIHFKVINSFKNNIYFEKIIESIDDIWSDGIWQYNVKNGTIIRIDNGHHVNQKDLYDIDIADISWQGENKIIDNHIFFTTLTEIDSEVFIEFYSINIITNIQTRILGFKYPKEDLFYKQVEIINDKYIIARFSKSVEYIDANNFDELYLIDVSEKKYYRINEPILCLTIGKFFMSNNKIIFEESYLDDEEHYEISNDIEDSTDDFDTLYELDNKKLLNKRILSIDIDALVNNIKSNNSIIFEIIDKIDNNGVIKIIGETHSHIYYKKRYYDNFLKKNNDFLSLRKLELNKSDVFAISKTNVDKTFVKSVNNEILLKANDEFIYYIDESSNNIKKIINFENEEIILKSRIKSRIQDFYDNQFLIIYNDKKHIYKIYDINEKEYIIDGKEISLINNNLYIK